MSDTRKSRAILLAGLIGCTGCAGNPYVARLTLPGQNEESIAQTHSDPTVESPDRVENPDDNAADAGSSLEQSIPGRTVWTTPKGQVESRPFTIMPIPPSVTDQANLIATSEEAGKSVLVQASALLKQTPLRPVPTRLSKPSSPPNVTTPSQAKSQEASRKPESPTERTKSVAQDHALNDTPIIAQESPANGILTIDGKRYRLSLVTSSDEGETRIVSPNLVKEELDRPKGDESASAVLREPNPPDSQESSPRNRNDGKAPRDTVKPNPVRPRTAESGSIESRHELAAYQGELMPPVPVVQASEIPVPVTNEIVTEPIIGQPITTTPTAVIEETPVIDINLPSALAMVGGNHPAVGFAQWRVQEAYAQLAQARALWLPSIGAGFSFHRHDGNYQASDGSIVDVNRNSFQYGMGTGATGAGTTPQPGLVARFHFADAIFQPKVAQRTAWASGHRAKATLNQQLREVAIAYTELVGAHQSVSILNDSRALTSELHKITTDFAESGEGLQADADRMKTELAFVDTRIARASQRVGETSARLAETLSIDPTQQIIPMDLIALPIDLGNTGLDKASLIGTGLSARPELSESQSLVAAACEAYRREKYAPFVPSVLLGFSTAGFGGGLGNNLNQIDGRYDFDAVVSWEVRNLGFGEHAARRRSSARIQQAKFEKLRVMDQIAREISVATAQTQSTRQQINAAQTAITAAQKSYNRNLERIKEGQGLPIEVLQSVQALEQARLAYAQAVIDHNRSEFQLQWALGWPVQAP